MSDKPSDKKDAGTADPKRPHATLDLKATEVKAAAEAKAAGEKNAAAAASAPKSDASAAKGSEPAKPAATQGQPARNPSPATRLLTHLAAGVAGGAVVLFGGDRIAEFTGTPSPGARLATVTTELEKRIAAIESAPTPNVQAMIDSSEERMAKLESLGPDVAALRDEQTKLAAETAAIKDRLPDSNQTAEIDTRLARLEDQLQTIAKAATSDTGSGRIADIAAITAKLAEIDARMSADVEKLREGAMRDIDQRLSVRDDAAKSELARLSQQVEKLKADSERFDKSVLAAQEEAGRVASGLGEIRATLEQQANTFAKSADVAAAVTPVAGLISKIEGNLEGVLRKEKERQSHTERIVTALELGNLKRAIDSGNSFATEFDAVVAASAGRLDLAALEPFKTTGVPSLAELREQARPALAAALDSGAVAPDASVMDRMLASAKSIVRVRRIDAPEGDASLEARVARIEKALAENRLGDALDEAGRLPPEAAGAIASWRAKLAARHSVDEAIATVENELKAALASPAPSAPADRDQ
jgi:hypothetical protein